MKLNLKFEPAEQGDGGVCHIFKECDGKREDIGYVVYGNKKELRWVHEVMLDGHPEVSIME